MATAGGAAGLAALLGGASPHLLIVSASEEPAGGCRPDADLLLFATPQPSRPGPAPRRPALGRPPVTRGTGEGTRGGGAPRGGASRRAGPGSTVPTRGGRRELPPVRARPRIRARPRGAPPLRKPPPGPPSARPRRCAGLPPQAGAGPAAAVRSASPR